MKIAISPCPNDTYLFHAWITGLVGGEVPSVTFADIQELNELAIRGDFSLIKLSFNCLKQVFPTYQLLPIGSALGVHAGPKIIAKAPFPFEALGEKKIAIPGKETTAHLLLEHLAPQPKEKNFCLYHEVIDLIERGLVDCGLIIHETRFTFASQGFSEIIDLGELWHERYTLPLPLGGLAIRRDFPHKERVLTRLQDSLAYARSHPKASQSFILKHSIEKDPSVIEQHIATYVNQETAHLSEEGKRAIQTLTGLCQESLFYSPSEQKPTPVCVS